MRGSRVSEASRIKYKTWNILWNVKKDFKITGQYNYQNMERVKVI